MKYFLSLLLAILPLSLFAASEGNLRNTDSIQVTATSNEELDTFMGPILEFFYTPSGSANAVENTFFNIAMGIKNFVVTIAVIFLLIAILKLLFSGGDEETLKKWRQNIIWVSVGIFVMQIAPPIWRTLFLKDASYGSSYIDGRVGWMIWINILEPIVNVLLLLSWLWFLAMGVYSFYILVTAWGDEERTKKGKNTMIYAVIGFLLVRIPKALVTAIYGTPSGPCTDRSWFSVWVCEISNQNLTETVNIFGSILIYLSGFLGVVAVTLVIYAGWLVLTSAWEEERLKKAKNIVLWIGIWFVLLVASHAIFRFFFLRG
jgi:hypothetical protein